MNATAPVSELQPLAVTSAVTAEAVASRLGIHKTTFFRWVSAGRFPPPRYRNGRKWVRWDAAQIDEYFARNSNRRIP